MIPFTSNYDESKDQDLIAQAKDGSQVALEKLIKQHQRFIYNVALKYIQDPDDAADLTQEVLIKVVTKLSQYRGKCSFRTWLYRIVVNHFLQSQQRKSKMETYSFEEYGQYIDEAYAREDMTTEEKNCYQQQILTTRNRCMSGMLLCLDQQQRMVFILGAIFNVKSANAARLLGITAENFRQLLSRSKADLFQFMENKCGLVNPHNPCRCFKKTKGLINEGKVDPNEKKFTWQTIESIQAVAPLANDQLDGLIEGKYLQFFKEQSYETANVSEGLLNSLLIDPEIKDLFRLN